MRPVKGGGSSSSSGPAVPEDVEESALVKKLVTLSAPTAADREERAHSQRACGVQDLVSRVLHRTWPNESAPCRRKRNHDCSDCH